MDIIDTPQYWYLLWLITWRWHIYKNRIVIEFSHKNKTIQWITRCPKCSNLCTKPIGGDYKQCKKCFYKLSLSDSNKITSEYNQIKSTKDSLNNIIIPFLKEVFKLNYSVNWNDVITYLIIDFNDNEDLFHLIASSFIWNSFDKFHIPQDIHKLSKQSKIEYINWILDTAWFNNSWWRLNRDWKNGHWRMRAYIQIVRNWYIVVEIDNFLRKEFWLPIQTIDWWHPNIRDQNMKDYYESNSSSWAREHQLKFFPEYFWIFKFRIEHKQNLFKELLEYNKFVEFDNKEDWFPPRIIWITWKLKPYHKEEHDPRMPIEIRWKHIESFWIINFYLWCTYLKWLIDKNPLKENILNYWKENTSVKNPDEYRKLLANKIHDKYFQFKKQSTKKVITENNLEKDMYPVLVDWLNITLNNEWYSNYYVLDTSAYNLDKLISANENVIEWFDFCDKYRIKPDVVWFVWDTNSLYFIEAKKTVLDIKSLWQLIWYCLVAIPEEAILVSTEEISWSLLNLINWNPNILEYWRNKKIKIGRLIWNEISFIF